MYKVNDGDVPPDGGDSNEALVSITIQADPPTSQNMAVTMDIDVPKSIRLTANDPNGDPLDYTITDLPTHGTLSDPNGGTINAAPYTLAGKGRFVLFTPETGYAGNDAFSFYAEDGIFQSNTATVNVHVIAAVPVITTANLPDGVVGQPYGPFQLANTGGQPQTSWSLVTDLVYVERDLGACAFAEVGTPMNWNGDDVFWVYNLPFPFPFYGVNRTEIRVWSNGIINFGEIVGHQYDNTDERLIADRRIAPLWDDLSTAGAGENIFIDTSVPGEITIRWKAHTYAGSHPVDVAATLRENGDILFHYGPSNAAVTPTIGVSDGTGSDYTLSQYNNSTSLTNANSMLLKIPDHMPAGMALSTDGVLSGAPEAAGTFEPVIRITDSLGRWDEHAFLLNVGAPIGDYDADGDIDLSDLAVLVDCHFGPEATPAPVLPTTAASCLTAFDFDGDGDVDLQDVAAFEQAFTGP